MNINRILILVTLAMTLAWLPVGAEPPRIISYQGALYLPDGQGAQGFIISGANDIDKLLRCPYGIINRINHISNTAR